MHCIHVSDKSFQRLQTESLSSLRNWHFLSLLTCVSHFMGCKLSTCQEAAVMHSKDAGWRIYECETPHHHPLCLSFKSECARLYEEFAATVWNKEIWHCFALTPKTKGSSFLLLLAVPV